MISVIKHEIYVVAGKAMPFVLSMALLLKNKSAGSNNDPGAVMAQGIPIISNRSENLG